MYPILVQVSGFVLRLICEPDKVLLLLGILLLLCFLKLVQCLQERVSPLFIKNIGVCHERSGVIPFIVPRQDVEGEEFENLNSRVEVFGSVHAIASMAFRAILEGSREVEVAVGRRRKIGL